jgi:phosphoglucomutase
MIASGNEYTPSLMISRALLTHNRGRKPGLADGIVVTRSHHPSQDRGFNASWWES